MKPFAQACENNKRPILAVLRRAFASCAHVLEIGSGTGQHAVFFASELPHLRWTASDLPQGHAGIRAWIQEAGLGNLSGPLRLDVNAPHWPRLRADGVFTANTLHIMGWPTVENLFAGLPQVVETGGVLAIYGPFRFAGQYTSDSNAEFDSLLRLRDAASGVRNFEEVDALARGAGFEFESDHPMPANNNLLVWRRS